MERKRFGRFACAISRIHHSIQQLKTAEMQQYGLKAVHVMCLYLLSIEPEGLSSAALVEQTGEDKAAISRAVKELRERDLVKPAADNSRSYGVPWVLTPQGVGLAAEVNDTIRDLFSKYAPETTEEERAVFYRVLLQISDNLSSAK